MGYIIITHPVICDIMILVSDDWCRMRVRPAQVVSYAFLYTTNFEKFLEIVLKKYMCNDRVWHRVNVTQEQYISFQMRFHTWRNVC